MDRIRFTFNLHITLETWNSSKDWTRLRAILLKCSENGRSQDHALFRRCQSVHVSRLPRVESEYLL